LHEYLQSFGQGGNNGMATDGIAEGDETGPYRRRRQRRI
jgi:hypothetical protein